MIIDNELYGVGSDNLYPGHLSEFNYVVEGKKAVEELIEEYWQQVWKYSSPDVFPKLNQDLYCSSGNANQTKNSL